MRNLQHIKVIKRVVTEPVTDAECSTESGGDTPEPVPSPELTDQTPPPPPPPRTHLCGRHGYAPVKNWTERVTWILYVFYPPRIELWTLDETLEKMKRNA